MQTTPAITSVLAYLLSLAEVRSHAIETRHCITNAGNLRIFIEHWHEDLTDPKKAGTMKIKHVDTDVTSTQFAIGVINNEPSSEIYKYGDCVTDETLEDTICISPDITNSYGYGPDDWVYFDFPATCNTPARFEILQGDTKYLQEGCKNLYPVTIQGNFTDQGPPSPKINGATCDDNTVISASTGSCDDNETIVIFSADAEDDCDPDPTVTLTQQPGTLFPVGDTSVTLTATDDEGKSKQCTFTVSVSGEICAPSPRPPGLPSAGPSAKPSISPSNFPSVTPSPSTTPSALPSDLPTLTPSVLPLALPSRAPSDLSTLSTAPSTNNISSAFPSCSPSDEPCESPSRANQTHHCIENYLGQDFSSPQGGDRVYVYTVIYMGNQGSQIIQRSDDGNTYLVGTYGGYDDNGLLSYTNGDNVYCDDDRSGALEIVESSSTTGISFSASEPSSCVYEFKLTIPSCPTFLPSDQPSLTPSASPSSVPSSKPSSLPSDQPSLTHSVSPSSVPSSKPTSSPSVLPSLMPSVLSSALPSRAPSANLPTLSTAPSTNNISSAFPSCSPSDEPSESPSVSQLPSNIPSVSNTPTKAGNTRKDNKGPKKSKEPKTKKGKKISCEN